MTLVARVRRLRTRLLAERTTAWAARAAMLSAPLWAAGWVGAGPVVGATELGLAAALGALFAWRTSLDATATARHVDHSLGLADRVLTAWTTQDDPSPMATLVERDADRAWQTADPAPLAATWPWRTMAVVLGLVAAAATWQITMPGGTEGVLKLPPERPAPIRQEAGIPTEPEADFAKAKAADPGAGVAEERPPRLRRVEAKSAAYAPSSAAADPSVIPQAPPSLDHPPTSSLKLPASGGDSRSDSPGAPGEGAAPATSSARSALPELPERYRPVVLRYLGAASE